MIEIILTVQPGGKNKFRLGISKHDSLKYFKIRGAKVELNLPHPVTTKTTCGPPLNKGFDLSCNEINEWIIRNKFNNYYKGQPTKLPFILRFENGTSILKYNKIK